MKINLTTRHFLNGDNSYEPYENLIGRLEDTRNIIQEFNFPIEINLNVSTLDGLLSGNIAKKVLDLNNSLKNKGIMIKYTVGLSTSGQKEIEALFNNEKKSGKDVILGIMDLDQYLPDSKDKIEAILYLCERMIRDSSLIGIGVRDIPVNLGTNKKASDLRIIHELIHTLTVKDNVFLPNHPSWKVNPSPCYGKIGDSSSGFCLINPNHSLYPLLREELLKNSDLYNTPPGFSVDYFISLWAGIKNSVSAGFVRCEENQYYINLREEDEINKSINLIKKSTSQLANTSVAPYLKDNLKNRIRIEKKLKEFFYLEDIKRVIELMDYSLLNFNEKE